MIGYKPAGAKAALENFTGSDPTLPNRSEAFFQSLQSQRGSLSDVEHTPIEHTSIPASALCPITHAPMADPVIASDGHSYERAAIEHWFRTNRTSPMTGEVLASLTLIPNHALRCIIAESGHPQPPTSLELLHMD